MTENMEKNEGDCYSSLEEFFLDCARYGDKEDLLDCIKDGAQLDCVDQNNNNAVHMCSANGHTEILRILCESLKNADKLKIINDLNSSGNTPLHWSTLTNKVDSVKILLEYDADVNLMNLKEEKAFDVAYNFCHSELVEIQAAKTDVGKEYLEVDDDETLLNKGNIDEEPEFIEEKIEENIE